MMKTFAAKTRLAIKQAVNVRLFLIETGKSKNSVEWQTCKKIINELEPIKSDKEMAQFLIHNYPIISHIVPGSQPVRNTILFYLLQEAKIIMRSSKNRGIQLTLPFQSK